MCKSKSFKARALTVAVVGALSIMSGAAKADVLATSVLQLNSLLFSHTGGAVLNANEFSTISYQNSADTSASFTGYTTQNGSGSGTPLNLPLIGVGSGFAGSGLTQNGFQPLAAVTGSFAAADQNELGFPIGGLGTPVGAAVDSGSWSQVQGPGGGNGSGTSNNGLTGRLIFAPTFTGMIDITGGYNFFWSIFMSAGEGAASSTQSRGVTDFTLVDLSAGGALVFDFAPSALNWNFSITGPQTGTDLQAANGGTGSFVYTTPTLFNSHLYLLTGTEQTLADTNRVPEPETLALMGIGLLGLMGGLSRRKSV